MRLKQLLLMPSGIQPEPLGRGRADVRPEEQNGPAKGWNLGRGPILSVGADERLLRVPRVVGGETLAGQDRVEGAGGCPVQDDDWPGNW